MKIFYILFFTILMGAISVNASVRGDNYGISGVVWQVPHKPKGIKTRINVSNKKSEEKDYEEKKRVIKASESKTSQKDELDKRYVALKTNFAYWAGAVANISTDIQLQRHISLEIPFNWSLWDMNREYGIRLVLLQPEARWWMKDVGEGHFIGVHAHAGVFNVKWQNSRYQTTKRPMLGAGITYGYSFQFSENWGAEFLVGLGYANMKYDEFYNIENGAKIGTDKYNYWGITKLGVSLVYRF